MSLITPTVVSLLSGIPIIALGFTFNWSAVFMTFLMAIPGFLLICHDVLRNEVYRESL